MFDLDSFVADCLVARRDAEPRRAIRDVLARAVSDGGSVAEALPPERAELVRLYVSEELTILKVVWAPGMILGPHDHRMWAAIGIYTGGEDNTFFRRDGATVVDAGGRSLRPGDVCMLGDDVVHAVMNPTDQYAGAIHIYGGDFFSTPRSEWRGTPPLEEPYDVQRALGYFEAANALGMR